MRRSLSQFLIMVFLSCSAAHAQKCGQQLIAGAKRAADLQFPAAPKTLSMFAANDMAIYKPDGDGPFPSLVLLHTCGGIREESVTGQSVALKRAMSHSWSIACRNAA